MMAFFGKTGEHYLCSEGTKKRIFVATICFWKNTRHTHTLRSAARVNPATALRRLAHPPSLQQLAAGSVKLPGRVASSLEQWSCQTQSDFVKVGAPCRGSIGGRALGRSICDAVEQTQGMGSFAPDLHAIPRVGT